MDINLILSQLTLEEKASLVTGRDFWNTANIDRLNIPSLKLTDGPHGVRLQKGSDDHLGINESVPATCFPPGCGLAASFDTDIAKSAGEAIGDECLANDVQVLLGPGVNIKRSPLCGRNFEYLSEDPILAGKIGASFVNGLQSKKVGACVKHFALNNQENNRMSTDSRVSERALREIYLKAFQIIVNESNPTMIMSSYNLINGTYSSENKHTLTDILRNEWDFKGAVVSDWSGTNNIIKSVANGQELEMPSTFGVSSKKVVDAVKNKELDIKDIDTAVLRLLGVIDRLTGNDKSNTSFDENINHEKARQAAVSCPILLKNEDNILPLSKDKKVALIGEFLEKPRYQGGGSSHLLPTKLDITLDEIKKFSTNVTYSKGYDNDIDKISDSLVEEALLNAKNSDVAVIFAGLPESYESEGYDRDNLFMPESHIDLILKVADVQKNLVVVLSNGSVVDISSFNDKVKGILECFLLGQGTGNAIARILFGDVSPSGRLPETIPCKLSDTSCFNEYPGLRGIATYGDDIFVGYRYYNKKEMDVLYPFGFGLSYSIFEYSNLKLNKDRLDEKDAFLEVTVSVKNTGKVDAHEVIQVYVRDKKPSVIKVNEELKAFSKVFIKAGKTVDVTLLVPYDEFKYFNEKANKWIVENSTFEILIGKNSREFVLSKDVEVIGVNYYNVISFDANNTVYEVLENDIGKVLLQDFVDKAVDRPDISAMFGGSDFFKKIFYGTPLRSLSMMANGAFDDNKLNELLNAINNK